MGIVQVGFGPAQVAPFRNPALPQDGLPTGQGLVQAGVIQGGNLQYLSQSPAGTWNLAPISQSQSFPAQQVVAACAPQPQNPPESAVYLFWSTGSGLWSTNLTSAGGWAGPASPDSSIPNLSGLGVAYTPGKNPVVYGIDASGDLWMCAWSGSGWNTTQYPNSSMQWGGAAQGLAVVFVSETSWSAFANSTTADALVAVAGTLDQGGGGSVGSVTTFGVPTAGSILCLVGGAVSPSASPANPSTACVFYIDRAESLMMWPSTLTGDAVVPVPDRNATTSVVAAPAVAVSWVPPATTFGSLGGGGTVTSLYQADNLGSVYALRQVAWVFENQLPFFAPPSYVVGQAEDVSAVNVYPDPRPTDIPAIFVVNALGWLYEYEPTPTPGTWNGSSQAGQWTGSAIDADT